MKSNFIAHIRRPFVPASLAALCLVAVGFTAAALGVFAQAAPVITSGPSAPEAYMTETTAVILWSTDVASTSVVEFGLTAALEKVPYRKIVPMEETEVLEANHSITLWELKSGTLYHYKVRSVSEGGGVVESGLSTFTTKSPAYTGPVLGAVYIEASTVGSVLSSPVDVSARIEGEAESVTIIVSPAAGGTPVTVAGTDMGGGIFAAALSDLAEGEWSLSARADGYDSSGAEISITSPAVSFSMRAEVTTEEPEEADETAEEPESEPEEEPVTEEEPEEEPVAEEEIVPEPDIVVEEEAGEPEAVVEADEEADEEVVGEETDEDAGEELAVEPQVVTTLVTGEEVVEGGEGMVFGEDVQEVLDTMMHSIVNTPVGVVVMEAVEEALIAEGEEAPLAAAAQFSMGVHSYGSGALPLGETLALPDELMESIEEFADSVSFFEDGATLGGSVGTVDVRTIAENLCDESSVAGDICQDWLAESYADKSCAEAGIITKGTCEQLLTEANDGIFPGCEDLSPEECAHHTVLVTIDYLQDEVLDTVNQVLEEAVKSDVLVELPGITSIKTELVGQARWWESPVAPGQETAPAVIVIDADLDGLPDDYERDMGLDPTTDDTDGDGVSDIDELQEGTDPLGEGELGRELDPTEETIVFRRPLEQPQATENVDEALSVEVASAVPPADDLTASGEAEEPADLVLEGRCDPNTTCVLYVYSYVPMVLTTTTDEAGNWQYDLGDSVIDGDHTVYVAVTDNTGKIVKRSNPLSFFVREARAVTFDDFVKMSAEPVETLSAGTLEEMQRKYLYGALAIVLVALVLITGVIRGVGRKKKAERAE